MFRFLSSVPQNNDGWDMALLISGSYVCIHVYRHVGRGFFYELFVFVHVFVHYPSFVVIFPLTLFYFEIAFLY